MSSEIRWKMRIRALLLAAYLIALAYWTIPSRVEKRLSQTAILALGGAFAIAFYAICELAGRRLGLSLPPPVVGLIAMTMTLLAIRPAYDVMGRVFDRAAPYMPLLFVPAGIGVLAAWDVLSASWAPLALAVTLGTAATLLITGLMAQHLFNSLDKMAEKPEAEVKDAI